MNSQAAINAGDSSENCFNFAACHNNRLFKTLFFSANLSGLSLLQFPDAQNYQY
jgi:hypothetical protein